MREQFITKNFSIDSRLKIQQANAIIDEYKGMGFKLTLRQLYYQFVARGIIPNKQNEYKTLGSVINDGRLAGKIDWDAIEDRTRNVQFISSWSKPQDVMRTVSRQYKEDLWRDQPTYVEVWIEKEALFGVIEPVCLRWRVPHFACRGYVSQSELYEAGKRFEAMTDKDRIVIIHLGDHDPSGIDMTRDNVERASMFARRPVIIERVALNMDQIEEYNPPPNPAKETDARIGGYKDLMFDHGYEDPEDIPSWELDALDPPVIDAIIEDTLKKYIDMTRWTPNGTAEMINRKLLQKATDEWPTVARWAKRKITD